MQFLETKTNHQIYFFLRICKSLMTQSNGILGEGNMVRHSPLHKWKSWQGAISRRSSDLRISSNRFFRFQKKC